MIVYTGGTFDLLHVGHLELLGACRALAGPSGRVVVSLNRDEFVARYKGGPPRQPYTRRREVLLGMRDVDAVVCNLGDEDSAVALDVVQPDLIAIGDDWYDLVPTDEPHDPQARYLAQLGISHAWLAERGLRVEYIARTRGTSSSALRA